MVHSAARILFITLVVVQVGCGASSPAATGNPAQGGATGGARANDPPGGTVESAPTDGSYSFVVKAEWHRPSTPEGVPGDALRDADFTQIAEARRYQVQLSEDGQSATITSESGSPTRVYTGSREASTDHALHYSLSAGAFAGGRFLLSGGAPEYTADLTLYGSGVPVVSSERGVLQHAP